MGEDQPDDEARRKDGEAAQRQVGNLQPNDEQARRRAHWTLLKLQVNQLNPDLDDPIPFELSGDGTDTDPFVLVARNQIVVITAPAPDQPAVRGFAAPAVTGAADGALGGLPVGSPLPIAGYEQVHRDRGRVPGLLPGGGLLAGLLPPAQPDQPDPGLVTTFRSQAPKTVEQLMHDARVLRDQHHLNAAVKVLAPLGHTVKAEDFPEPAATAIGAFPPPGAEAPPTGRTVRVAILDTGMSRVARADGWLRDVRFRVPEDVDCDLVPPVDRIDSCQYHGTFVAGVIKQVAPFCEVVAYRFTSADGMGTEEDLADALLMAVADARRDGVELVVNMSVGIPLVDGRPPVAIGAAVKYVAENHPEVVMVAAAGNEGTAAPIFPAAFDDVVSVAALLADGATRAPFSSFGTSVNFSSVGVGVVSTFAEGKLETGTALGQLDFGPDPFAVWSGTSFAAPQVSGAIAERALAEQIGVRDALAKLAAGGTALEGLGTALTHLPGTPLPTK